jgi:radical SAM superfamily enzyme YgiQ (UPF0313 family)
MRVQLHEHNIRLGKSCYLPLATGLLRAYAERDPLIKEHYTFSPFLYHIDSVANILKAYEQPVDVAAFSTAVWNEQLNLAVAAEVKQRWPDCLIIFGGLQVPDQAMDYLTHYKFIDIAIRRAGEVPFANVLRRYASSREFEDIPQITWRERAGAPIYAVADEKFVKDLDDLPSPALDGLFDYLLPLNGVDVDFSYVLETNRGCMYRCSFCEYGLGQHKLSYYEMDRVFGEIEWAGRNKIGYLLGADANFAILPRDMEIAKYLVATKKKYGYPDKFRVNYAKNTGDKVYNVGLLLHEADMTKSITLARQSNDAQVLKNIQRENIKMSTYQELQTRFNDVGVPTYSEFIVGLPGETYEGWKRGLDDCVAAGMKNQLLVYPLMALPNTDMGREWYQKQHGIQTRRLEAAEVHGTRRAPDMVAEYETIVVETSTMSLEEWRQTVMFSWIFGALHGLKLGYFIMIYLLDRYGIKPSELVQFIMDEALHDNAGPLWRREFQEYNKTLDGVLEQGQPMATILPEFGDIYWSGEEASFLRLTDDLEALDSFYLEDMTSLLIRLLDLRQKKLGGKAGEWELDEVCDVLDYQNLRVPTRQLNLVDRLSFGYNLHTYFESAFTSKPRPLQAYRQRVKIKPVDYHGDRQLFAREVVVIGRKSNKVLVPAIVI